MCGRFSLGVESDRLVAEFGLADMTEVLPPRWNIAPTQPVAAVVRGPSGLRLGSLRWGLVPRHAREMTGAARMINARAETIEQKPAFAEPFRRRRCWILADGFYEWRKEPDGRRSPFHFRRPDGRPFALAGLWDRWLAPDGTPLLTCTIVTTAASGAVAGIHDRMPVILGVPDREMWLDPGADQASLEALLRPSDPPLLAHRVSTRVNRVENDDPGCVTPLEAGETSA